MTATLSAARIRGHDLELNWRDGRPNATLPLIWLRDNCQSEASQHPVTKQRLVDTFRIPADIAAREIALEDQGRVLKVEWADGGHVSRFEAAFLSGLRFNPEVLPVAAQTWDRDAIGRAVPQVPHHAFMHDDAALKLFLEQLARFGLCFIEGAPGTPEGTKAVAARIAYIRETIFGGYWDFTANMEHKDTAYTSMAIGPHTDGTYSIDAPGYQMFHCLAAECTGGENVLVDGFRIAGIMSRDRPTEYRLLTEVAIPGQYLDHDRGIHLMARRPLFRLDDSGALVQVTYNNYDRAPFALPAGRHKAFYQALASFDALCNDATLQHRRRLLPGSVLVFDNWRVLHARDAYTGYRRLAGVYFNREDVESRLRFLRIRAGEPV
ncbi:MAG TPA: trimethyllysine dioxygenase [Steroidobacteraceae bacterium]|nr:trimethyllysine dioxygenase [Steroidobacteraceae bacterium]